MLEASGKKHNVAIVHVLVSSINLYTGTFVCWDSLPIFVAWRENLGHLKHLRPGAPPVPASPCPGL